MCPPAFVMDSVVLICRDRPRTAATEGVPSQDKRGGLSLRWAEAGCAMVSQGAAYGVVEKARCGAIPLLVLRNLPMRRSPDERRKA